MAPIEYTVYGVKYSPGCVKHCLVPDSKVNEANIGSICGRQNPGGPHVDPKNPVIWVDAYVARRFSSL